MIRSFPANAETRLDLANKCGTVHVAPWERDSVRIEIDLFVKSSSTSKLQKLKRNVDFEYAHTSFGRKGSVSVSLSNGDTKANNLREFNISPNFGNGIIKQLNRVRLNIAYADIEIQQVNQLDMESKSSRIRIRETGILKTVSRRDKFTVSRLDNRLEEEINYHPKYGGLKVDSISMGFSLIHVNTEQWISVTHPSTTKMPFSWERAVPGSLAMDSP